MFRFRRSTVVVALLLLVIASGCQAVVPEAVEVPVTVEVTRIVEMPIEEASEAEAPVEQPAADAPVINPMFPMEFDTIESSATGQEYAITVVLPLTYGMSDANYPVFYVTDGNFYAIPLAMAAGQLAFGKEIPEFITIGVDYGTPNPMEWLELRDLDMGPEGRAQYLQFFEEELIPYIESTYRVDPAHRTLAGHSSGGDFALYALLNAADTFGNVIASSPGGAAGLVDTVEDFAANQGEATAKLYLSVGDMDAEPVVTGVKAFDDALFEMGVEGLVHEMMVLDGETHLSARPRAFNNGMRWLFAGDAEGTSSTEEDSLMTRTTQEVFDSHKEAIETLNIEKLMADYAEDAVLVTLDGAFYGKDAILTGFFQAFLEQFPDLAVTYDKIVCEGDVCLLQWSGDASAATIPVGIGVLIIQDGLIQRQVEWAEIVPKVE